MPRLLADISHQLLRWARETAGLNLQTAAKRIGVSPERLTSFEDATLKPTVGQLRQIARVYKRPLAMFFLDAPPALPPPLRDFRRLPGVEVPPTSSKLLLLTRRARRRRKLALELLSDLQRDQPTFPIVIRQGEPVDEIAATIRTWIGLPLEEQRQWRSGYEALNAWIGLLERRGVLVFQAGDVPLREMRGFSLSEALLPAIVLNGKDSPRARAFTLIHELTHLGLRQSGLCNPTRAAPGSRTDEQAIETYCNRVAGAILVPTDAISQHPAIQRVHVSTDWDEGTISEIAEQFAVSREVILFRLLSLDLVSQDFVSRKLAEYDAQYARRPPSAGFLPVYRRVVRDNGILFTRLVLNALERDQITPADFSDFLGVQLKHLDRIADEAGGTPTA